MVLRFLLLELLESFPLLSFQRHGEGESILSGNSLASIGSQNWEKTTGLGWGGLCLLASTAVGSEDFLLTSRCVLCVAFGGARGQKR